jgi:hypothetical protein
LLQANPTRISGTTAMLRGKQDVSRQSPIYLPDLSAVGKGMTNEKRKCYLQLLVRPSHNAQPRNNTEIFGTGRNRYQLRCKIQTIARIIFTIDKNIRRYLYSQISKSSLLPGLSKIYSPRLFLNKIPKQKKRLLIATAFILRGKQDLFFLHGRARWKTAGIAIHIICKMHCGRVGYHPHQWL